MTKPPKWEAGTGKNIPEDVKAWFYSEVRAGRNPYQVGAQAGISRTSTRRLMVKAKGMFGPRTEDMSPIEVAELLARDESPDANPNSEFGIGNPILKYSDLPSKYARQAWKEFGYFRVRYYNRRHIAWQIEMAQILMAWMEIGKRAIESGSDISGGDIVKGIINTPPGGGKTTTITHDFPSWLIARNRNIRVALGSRTTGQAERYTRRLRTTFEKNLLLGVDFGRFKPEEPELWRRDQFLVDGVVGHLASIEYKLAIAGLDHQDPRTLKRLEDPDDPIHEILEGLESLFVAGEKEPTVSSLSREMGFLGGRYELALWDDLVDKTNVKNADARDDLADWWHSDAESRVEPGGLVGLIGTRAHRFDLYNHCKELTYQIEDDDDFLDSAAGTMTEEELQEIREDLERELVDRHGHRIDELTTPVDNELRRSRRVYFYHRFPAHDENKCLNPGSMKNGDHTECVLDPVRFNYRYLMKAQASNLRNFKLTYQQEDDPTAENLVQKIWLTGGSDKDGFVYPGCYNYNRRLLEIPPDIKPEDCFSIATVDPSATNFWSIQWWIWDAANDRDYLINQLRARLSAGQFLDWDRSDQVYRGVLQDWQIASAISGWPISLWIVEQAAAQRYLFQYTWVKDWMKMYHTLIKGHETNINKSDPDYGIETLGPRYRRGIVDLPMNQSDLRTRAIIGEFAQELTEWPDGQTEDMVMGHWFLQYNRDKLPDSLRVSSPRSFSRHPYSDEMPEPGQWIERPKTRIINPADPQGYLVARENRRR